MPEDVRQPIPGPEAFRATGDTAAQSQAAILLATGRQLRGDDDALLARANAAGMADRVESVDTDAEGEFPLPRVRTSPERFTPGHISAALPPLLADAAAAPLAEAGVDDSAARAFRAEVAEQLYRDASPETAATLLQASLSHPDELVRVSAAASYIEISADPRPLLAVLADGVRSGDELTRDVAATALARYAPDHPRLQALTAANPTDTDLPPSHTALMVHGTWARNGRWWQPGGDFHTYVKGWRPDLYSASDRFDWSGAYTDAARRLGGIRIQEWVKSRSLDGLDLFTHSHGGSISMLANHAGMDIGCLVLLSCPVHVHRYFPDFSRVRRGVVSVRVKMDLVILADGGGQRYRDPRIREHVLPLWFNHSASHEPRVWKEHDVADRIECGRSPSEP